MNEPIFKDEFGIWRDRREMKYRIPGKCPNCGSRNIEQALEDYEQAHEDEAVKAAYESLENGAHIASYTRDVFLCGKCLFQWEVGPRRYIHPEDLTYDQPPILLPEEAERLLAKMKREEAIKAGQMELFR